jgi:hypothetical protein
MNKRTNHILEIFWLIVAILSLIAGIHQTFTEGFGKSWLFFLIAVVGFLMFYLRRNLRKKIS